MLQIGGQATQPYGNGQAAGGFAGFSPQQPAANGWAQQYPPQQFAPQQFAQQQQYPPQQRYPPQQ